MLEPRRRVVEVGREHSVEMLPDHQPERVEFITEPAVMEPVMRERLTKDMISRVRIQSRTSWADLRRTRAVVELVRSFAETPLRI